MTIEKIMEPAFDEMLKNVKEYVTSQASSARKDALKSVEKTIEKKNLALDHAEGIIKRLNKRLEATDSELREALIRATKAERRFNSAITEGKVRLARIEKLQKNVAALELERAEKVDSQKAETVN